MKCFILSINIDHENAKKKKKLFDDFIDMEIDNWCWFKKILSQLLQIKINLIYEKKKKKLLLLLLFLLYFYYLYNKTVVVKNVEIYY